ncbi:MAG TPA: ADP-forming succinate--CoA ligase subunit beta [Candidatus Binatia bacterium]|jgi:succinyl-CoA synthetase beta subunit
MNLHEFQAKALIARYGVRVPRGEVAETPEKAGEIAAKLGSAVVVVKAQIHAGGRGAGAVVDSEADAAAIFAKNLAKEGLPKHDRKGGVRVVKSAADATAAARAILGKILVTRQTGASGRQVRRVLVEEGCDIGRELYLSVLLDRAVGRVILMASQAGGMDIEHVAATTPEKIFRVTVDPALGLQDHQARRLAFQLAVPAAKLDEWVAFFHAIYNAYVGVDASLVEINPLVQTGDGSPLALDAKVSIDDNALYRHDDVRELRDENEEDPKERAAAKFDLSYIALSGNIGCMVNGAGLAMATMDIIHHHGGEPANFCDVGGGATTQKVAEAFKIILSDANVKAVFINIFGGIMKCDVLAQGVVEASRQVGVKVPLVVRMEGTNVDEGKRIIGASGLGIITAADMADGAKKAVEAAGKAH